MDVKLINGDCLMEMASIPDGSVDLVLCDLPYGTTRCKWDAVIPFEPLWCQYRRLLRKGGVAALTACQPFTSALVMSNVKQWRHEWIWIKNRGSNFANTVREPFKEHETVQVFSDGGWTYNKQMQERTGGGRDLIGSRQPKRGSMNSPNYGGFEGRDIYITDRRVPSSWQKFNTEVGRHPTQKPVALMEYLIRTYTNEGDFVLDNCMGSGTTGVACLNTGRRFIGIERDPEYFRIASERIAEVREKTPLF